MGDIRLPDTFPLAGTEKTTISTTAVALTVPAGATGAVVYIEDQPVRWRDDGTAPTATLGVLAKADSSVEVKVHSLTTIKFIRQGGTDAAISVAYYK